jgi:hypothetical protein
MGWGHVAGIEEDKECIQNFGEESLWENIHLKDSKGEGRITLR